MMTELVGGEMGMRQAWTWSNGVMGHGHEGVGVGVITHIHTHTHTYMERERERKSGGFKRGEESRETKKSKK